MKKILIINAYSYKNRGDSGIVVSMIDLLRKVYANETVEISVMSQYYKENIEFYKGYDVRSIPPVWNVNSLKKNFITKYFEGIKNVIFFKSRDIQEYSKADIVLSAGGGYLYSSRKGFFGIGFLNCLYHIWLAKKLNKKVFLFPQSLGPLNSFLDKFVLKKVFNKADVFYSREGITTALAKKIGITCEIKEVPDIAFTLDPKPSRNVNINDQIEKNGYNIGITVLDWRFAKRGSNENDINLYLNKIANSLESIKKEFNNINVFIFPQVTVSDEDGDMKVSIKLQEILGDVSKVIDLNNLTNPKELVYLYSKMDVFIASRMHSAIFALAGNTATIGLSYQPKTTGTFGLIGLEENALVIDEFTEEELFLKLKSLIKNSNSNLLNNRIIGLKNFIEMEISKDLI